MKCVNCLSEKTDVIDSRPVDATVRRRRECPICKHRFTTREYSDEQEIGVPVLNISGVDPATVAALRALIRSVRSDDDNNDR